MEPVNGTRASPDATVEASETVEAEFAAESDYQQVDTNTQSNPQEVEYAIEKVMGHEITPQGLMYRVWWYGYGLADDTPKPIANLPRKAVMEEETK